MSQSPFPSTIRPSARRTKRLARVRCGLLAGLCAALLLAGCTRDRVLPEPTITLSNVQSAAGPSSATGADAQPVDGEAASETPTPNVADGSSAEPLVEVQETPTPPSGTGDEQVDRVDEEGDFPAIEYIVQAGDSVSTIAEKFGTDAETLRQLNFIPNDEIYVGQPLRVPGGADITSEGIATPTPEPFRYVVQDGDMLSALAQRFDVDPTEIIQANTIGDDNNLLVGQVLIIPGYQPTGGAEGDAANDAGNGSTGNAGAEGGTVVHTVQDGEQLFAIAELYGVPAADIAAANGIQNANVIVPGQELLIPGITQAEFEAANRIVHTVQQGETLGEIALLYGVTQQSIIDANNITNPNILSPGSDLIIP